MSKLYLVPTPIGNLKDITLRALEVLKEVDVILAEDTRKSGILLKHYDIEKKLMSHHQHNEHRHVESIVQRIASGQATALISDAGTPAISDPGFLLVRECIKLGIEVECLPGATAFVPALVNSGLPCDRFVFEGFLPHKKGRQSRLEKIANQSYTSVLYESPFRLIKTLEQLIEHLGPEHLASVSRELSKIHEETVRGSLLEIINHFKGKTVKGECVIVIAGNSD